MDLLQKFSTSEELQIILRQRFSIRESCLTSAQFLFCYNFLIFSNLYYSMNFHTSALSFFSVINTKYIHKQLFRILHLEYAILDLILHFCIYKKSKKVLFCTGMSNFLEFRSLPYQITASKFFTMPRLTSAC